jgi:hypothetical protein
MQMKAMEQLPSRIIDQKEGSGKTKRAVNKMRKIMMATKMKKVSKLIQKVRKTNVKTRKMSMTPRTISIMKERR